MRKNYDKQPENFRPTPEFFQGDDVATEIRNIVQRIVDAYYDFAPKGRDVGIITDDDKRDVISRLSLAYHDLEEFDVRENIHVGEDQDFFKDPRNLAEYVGGADHETTTSATNLRYGI